MIARPLQAHRHNLVPLDRYPATSLHLAADKTRMAPMVTHQWLAISGQFSVEAQRRLRLKADH